MRHNAYTEQTIYYFSFILIDFVIYARASDSSGKSSQEKLPMSFLICRRQITLYFRQSNSSYSLRSFIDLKHNFTLKYWPSFLQYNTGSADFFFLEFYRENEVYWKIFFTFVLLLRDSNHLDLHC